MPAIFGDINPHDLTRYSEGKATMYYGEKENGLYHVDGLMIFIDGAQYEEGFLNGKKHGHGLLTVNPVLAYTGWWVDDQLDGFASKVNSEKVIRGRWLKGWLVEIDDSISVDDECFYILKNIELEE